MLIEHDVRSCAWRRARRRSGAERARDGSRMREGPRDADGGRFLTDILARTAAHALSRYRMPSDRTLRPVLDVLAAGLRAGAAPNLASGAFAPRHRGGARAGTWRIAATLAAAVVLLAVIGQAGPAGAARAQSQRAGCRRCARSTAKRFPAATRITADVRAQMQGELASHGLRHPRRRRAAAAASGSRPS